MSVLRFDPLQLFRSSVTPVGLYARQKWLGEANTGSWHTDYNHKVESLLKGQSHNGSWGNSEINTIHRLFDLHLTVREANDAIDSALDWLLGKIPPSLNPLKADHKERITARSLMGLPFSATYHMVLLITATLFLCTVFGRGKDDRVLNGYRQLEKAIKDGGGQLHGWHPVSNILRALVVHESFSDSDSTKIIVTKMGKVQNDKGDWGKAIPFYRTFNALAHLDLPEADSQFGNALKRLYRTQSKDGSWGKTEPEFNTFLVVHALKRKGILQKFPG